MNRQIRLEVYRQNFRLYVPKFYKNMMGDFTSRLISYSKMFNKKKKRYISIEDKRWWVERNLGLETMYIFQIELLRDIMLFFKIQGVDILNRDLFILVNKDSKQFKEALLKVKDFYILRDYQDQYVGTVCENNMRKALIELQTGQSSLEERH